MPAQQIAIRDLRLADVCQVLDNGPWGSATVTQIKDGVVHFERPYGTTSDFSYTGGVIAYVGCERFTRFLDDDRTILVWERKDLK